MNNLRLFCYEARRIIFTKKYLGILLVITVYSVYVMINKTIMGEADTSPFSEWSFSAFLCSMDILLLPILLFFCTSIYTKKEIAAKTIILTSPLSCARYYLIKIAALLSAFLIMVIPVLAAILIFYSYFFNFNSFGILLAPTLLSLILPAVFILGLGIFLGSININFLYAFIPAVFVSEIAGFWSITGCLYSIKISKDGNIPFELPACVWVIRFAMASLGFLLIYITIIRQKKSAF